uniref:Uncharacterized protein n=1 Tax=Cucumis melo TaxID=3656 RepID=A0A9I9E665_CUCME
MYGSGNFLVLCRYVWNQKYKKRDTICGSNRNRICYSSSSGSRMQRAEVMIKGLGLRRDAALRAIRRS